MMPAGSPTPIPSSHGWSCSNQPLAVAITSSWRTAPATASTRFGAAGTSAASGRSRPRASCGAPTAGVPAISRPSGWLPNRTSSNIVNTWSPGESSYIRISSTITGFSADQVLLAQERAQDQLRDDLHPTAGGIGGHLGAIDGELPVRGGVDRAPAALDRLRQLPGDGECGGALEHEVLEHVRDAGPRRVLVPRAHADEQPDGYRAGDRAWLVTTRRPLGSTLRSNGRRWPAAPPRGAGAPGRTPR